MVEERGPEGQPVPLLQPRVVELLTQFCRGGEARRAGRRKQALLSVFASFRVWFRRPLRARGLSTDNPSVLDGSVPGGLSERRALHCISHNRN